MHLKNKAKTLAEQTSMIDKQYKDSDVTGSNSRQVRFQDFWAHELA